ncbi:MAG: serine hydrolase [Gammaproteobacteria bacterium]|nr:serine hydrolase [Gammaproteobacteria bacterium]
MSNALHLILRRFARPLAASVAVMCALSAYGDSAPDVSELMQGFPPAADHKVSRSNFMLPPNNRWAFQHIRELQPTREIWRGNGPVVHLPEKFQALGTFTATVREGRKVSLDMFLEESHTDGFVVLHDGAVVYERYLNGQQRHTQHQMFSATKSYVGTLVLLLAHEGRIDLSQPMARYLPELESSAFCDATVQQVLHMTTGVKYTEIYDDPESDIWKYGHVFRVWGEPEPGYKGALNIYDYLPTLPKQGTHGEGFHYVTPNTDVLGWLIRRITGKSVDTNISERFMQPLGAERDAYIWLDDEGNEMAGGGLNVTARDAARFGAMIVNGGSFNGQQIIPRVVAERILAAGDSATFRRFYDDPWYLKVGHSYKDQWWVFDNPHKAVSAIGIHGQFIYMDPVAKLVVVKQSSSPDAEGGANESNDTDGPMIYQALAEHLLKNSR